MTNRTNDDRSKFMPIWRIIPAPRDLEAALLDYGHWAEILVRAGTAAEARMVAAAELGERSRPVANESAAGYSSIEDEKLYHVIRVTDPMAVFAGDTRRTGVLKADWRKGAE
jgi:hypothetical protein